MKLFHYNNLFYTVILTVIFFCGMDGSLLYQRTFLDSDTRTFYEYLHFYLSILGGWFIGYFFIRKIVDKYNPAYVFRVSLLIASLSIWIQYKTNHHSMDRTFSYLIIDNIFCSILLGLLTYSLVKIVNGKNEMYYIRKQKHYSWLLLSLGFIYSQTLTDDKLDSGFLLSCFVYFVAYLYFLKNGINKFDYSINLNPQIPLAFMCVVVLISMGIVYFRTLEILKFYSEESYPIIVFLVFIIFELTQHDKNLITKVNNLVLNKQGLANTHPHSNIDKASDIKVEKKKYTPKIGKE